MVTINPYGDSTTILDAARFVGRVEALEYLYAEIMARRCVSVVGTRRVGKSSLLRCMCLPEVQQRFAAFYDAQKYLLVFIDLGEFLSKTSDEFFAAVSMQLVAQGRGRLSLAMPQEAEGGDGFCLLLDQIREQGLHTVLLFDAFHKITQNTHFDPPFFSFMRAQANNGRVSYITASITTLDKCCHAYIEGSPFFNIFNVYRLGPLEQDEARQLVMEPGKIHGSVFSAEEEKELLSLAGRHPFFIQRVAFFLFKERYQNQAGQTGRARFKQEAYHDLMPHFKDIWENALDSGQREHLREEAYWKQMRARRHPELGESGLFRRFVRDIYNIQPVNISADDLESMLDNLSNAKFLGESDLTHLYLFAVRAQNVSVMRSINGKGMIVRRILQEARDRLRPGGEQSNTAPEWQFVNILNNRYFMEQMKNEPLADLLGISVRQLHRERRLAIDALLGELQEMEMAAREDLDIEA